MPSQRSGVAAMFWLHTIAPPVHAVVPPAHTPGLPVLHDTLPPGLPLSTAPSQSLSRPSHTSGLGCTFWLQTIAPFVHAVVPAAHTPRLPVLHATLPPGLPLSIAPSQSLSRLSQISGTGCWF